MKSPFASSDVTRPRRVGVLALGSAIGAGVAVAASGAPPGATHAVSRPHAVAEVGCATCHAPDRDPAYVRTAACETCHGRGVHRTRGAHASLFASGALTCATCHPAHEGAQGVTFTKEGARRWSTGRDVVTVGGPALAERATVPLVRVSACVSCHDANGASDPLARCVPASGDPLATTAVTCFDEHAAMPPSGRARCASQHAADRGVAHDAARVVAATSSWVTDASPEGSPWAPAVSGIATALGLGLVASGVGRLGRRARAAKAAPLVVPPERRLPVIDPSTCLGCHACVDACPFDVLAVERYVAVVARPEECCGVVLCAQVCPNGSLRIAEEGAPAKSHAPPYDEHLESSDVPGVFLAGDLTGVPLVKNAIHQGTHVVDRIASTLPRRSKADVDVDVLVVGAGPAGLSAALRAREKGLSCVVVERATLAASIKSFPRDKIVHDPPLHLPVVGELWLREATKEELVAQWTRIVRTRALDVREGRELVALEGSGDGDARALTATLRDGERTTTLRARRVVLAIGRRGTPRTIPLTLSGRADEHVFHGLADARSFAGKRVVVVGLGDAALEAIVALARQPGTNVVASYRGPSFRRGKTRNVDEVKSLVARGVVEMRWSTVPTAFDGAEVTLASTAGGAAGSVAADAVLVLLGGEPASGLLERLGLRAPRDSDPERKEQP